MLRPLWAILPFAVSACVGCGEDAGSGPGPYVQLDTLESGVLVFRYSRLPVDRVATATPELRLGVLEGDPNLVFGDVRSVDAGEDGRIYVLDYLASEIRAFDSSGAFLHKVAGKGEGPGELGRPNGMILVGDTILWVQDPSRWMMIGLRPEGGEIARAPMPVRSYAFVWQGTVDNTGRIWKPDSHFDGEDTYEPREGLNELSVRLYLKSLDVATSAVDSVYLGDFTTRTLVRQVGNGTWHLGIPFLPARMTAVDPDGGFWQSHTSAYRLARMNGAGDTILVVEVEMDAVPVESTERAEHVDRLSGRDPGFRRTAEEVADLIPEVKPLIKKLIMDDAGRLWVERTMKEGIDPLYDVFNRHGEYLGSVELGFRPDEFRPIRIRHGHIYAVVLDDLDVPSIVRARVPALIDGPTRTSGQGKEL